MVDAFGGCIAVGCNGVRGELAGKEAAITAFLDLGLDVAVADAGVTLSVDEIGGWLSRGWELLVENLAGSSWAALCHLCATSEICSGPVFVHPV